MGKDENQKLSTVLLPQVVGAKLSDDVEHFPSGQVKGFQQLLPDDHRQGVHCPGEPGHLQKEAEESFPAAFVGKCGQFQKTAPKMRLVCWIFHKYHPIVFVG